MVDGNNLEKSKSTESIEHNSAQDIAELVDAFEGNNEGFSMNPDNFVGLAPILLPKVEELLGENLSKSEKKSLEKVKFFLEFSKLELKDKFPKLVEQINNFRESISYDDNGNARPLRIDVGSGSESIKIHGGASATLPYIQIGKYDGNVSSSLKLFFDENTGVFYTEKLGGNRSRSNMEESGESDIVVSQVGIGYPIADEHAEKYLNQILKRVIIGIGEKEKGWENDVNERANNTSGQQDGNEVGGLV